MPELIEIGGDTYETVPDESRVATEYLMKVRDRLGIPDDVSTQDISPVIIKYATEIYKVWASLFPEEHLDFIRNTAEELKYERPIQDAIKAGGYSPMAFPNRLHELYRVLIPNIKVHDKRFWVPLLSQVPELKRTNYFIGKK